jgi:tRNA(fMet)-specific endonuclease VapC
LKLLDTDTCVAILRGNQAAVQRRAGTQDEVVTTWITAAELFYGAAKSSAPAHNHTMVTSFLATLPVLGLDVAGVQVFGMTKALLERQGRRLDDADLFIGAIAVAQNATVVTGTGATTSVSPASPSRTGSVRELPRVARYVTTRPRSGRSHVP